jgi:hypothetical protein
VKITVDVEDLGPILTPDLGFYMTMRTLIILPIGKRLAWLDMTIDLVGYFRSRCLTSSAVEIY